MINCQWTQITPLPSLLRLKTINFPSVCSHPGSQIPSPSWCGIWSRNILESCFILLTFLHNWQCVLYGINYQCLSWIAFLSPNCILTDPDSLSNFHYLIMKTLICIKNKELFNSVVYISRAEVLCTFWGVDAARGPWQRLSSISKVISQAGTLQLESMALVKHSDTVNFKCPCTVTARKLKMLNNLFNLP